MMCPACDKKSVAADQIVCLRCGLDARSVARATGADNLPDDALERAFVRWAKLVRREGGSLPLAVMAECGQGPQVKSDSTFMGGYAKTGGAQFDGQHPLVQKTYVGQAKKAGVSITGKRYFSELAAFPGDPQAWVGSKADAAAVVAARPGWASEDLGVKAETGTEDLQTAPKAAKRASFKETLGKALQGG